MTGGRSPARGLLILQFILLPALLVGLSFAYAVNASGAYFGLLFALVAIDVICLVATILAYRQLSRDSDPKAAAPMLLASTVLLACGAIASGLMLYTVASTGNFQALCVMGLAAMGVAAFLQAYAFGIVRSQVITHATAGGS